MSTVEIAFYIVVGICNLLLATEWAKHGLWEIGIQRPPNKRAMFVVFIGTMTVFVSGTVYKYAGIEPPPMNKYVLALVVGVPLLWIPFFRRVLMSPGLADFNRARTRINYWALRHYIPGEKTSAEGAEMLRNFPMALSAIKMLKRALAGQLAGQKVHTLDRAREISEVNTDWDGAYIDHCPVCPSKTRITNIRGQNFSYVCRLCSSVITARIEGDKVYTHAILSKPIRRVTDRNKYNAATINEALGWLYRMMNLFEDAKNALGKSLAAVDELLTRAPENHEYLGLRSLVLFRLAEVDHAQGNLDKAAAGFRERLAIDRKLGDSGGIRVLERLLSEIEKTREV